MNSARASAAGLRLSYATIRAECIGYCVSTLPPDCALAIAREGGVASKRVGIEGLTRLNAGLTPSLFVAESRWNGGGRDIAHEERRAVELFRDFDAHELARLGAGRMGVHEYNPPLSELEGRCLDAFFHVLGQGLGTHLPAGDGGVVEHAFEVHLARQEQAK